MISVKKQGRFEVFSRGVEEPWAIYLDGAPFAQAWAWPEVEAILADESSIRQPAASGEKLTPAQRRALERLAVVGPVRRVGHEFRDSGGKRVTGLHAPTVRDLASAGLVEQTSEKHVYPARGRGKLRRPAWETTVPVYRVR